jgi:hygromycin-B 4-O-kinase
MDIDSHQTQAFLVEHVDPSCSDVEPIGQGAWSRCFGFRCGDEELVIRFGRHVDDFLKDQHAYRHTTPELPIPRVRVLGHAFDGYYAIATRVHGVALETLDVAQWQHIMPALVTLLEALRTTDLSGTRGRGLWSGDGHAPHASWSGHLEAIGAETPGQRTHGWREKLTSSTDGDATFTWGFRLLEQMVDDSVPRSLIHADLINRNVLVGKSGVAGVLDWGNSRYGDHLYDLAWFEFWAPWYPELDIPHLRSELERRWLDSRYVPANMENRLQACYLHIGLDHLAYNAWLENWPGLAAVAERMRALVSVGARSESGGGL